ncbi:uncharacterized protein LOC127871667 isoform X2 [Dreissena polymorpha]|uniref:Mab-21-like HhH/H2TH-like domain-containing protein n=2 Tax=Dreissena polymorpha TaxID=45954 RepID=A0A9D4LJ69_DREPO|nr:uncharacterized protein LOC127871667 isoform X2 [Dreissena polymorpha]KAH3858729.1 hypothetical protein DPMN_101356 [Dreissena polymorpha]
MAEAGSIRCNDSGRISAQGSLFSRHDLWGIASSETCTAMNWLGYGPEIRQARRDAYTDRDRMVTERARGEVMQITTGSKGEGLTCFLENDRDVIFASTRVICLEENVDACDFSKETTVFRSYNRVCYPGHCILRLKRRGTTRISALKNALCDNGYGRVFLSSKVYLKAMGIDKPKANTQKHPRAGPSVPRSYYGTLHTDTVPALRYYCPSILTKWAARTRTWPPPKVVQDVVSLGAFLTPVGCKCSEVKDFEWRICFNTGEIELVTNLNDTQVKLYVLLKMLKKDVLKPRKKEITSFTLKNLVFWLAEKHPQALFHERSLFHWLHVGLDALRVAIDTRELPYYMIPERNLMEGCDMDCEHQHMWISTIQDMMDEGPRVILRLPKIRQTIIAHPEPLLWYSRRRTELELLYLMDMNRRMQCRDKNWVYDTRDVIFKTIKRRKHEITYQVGLRMYIDGSSVNSLNDVWQSLLM